MAFYKVDIDEFKGFSRRLVILARENDIGAPELLARALYEHPECKNLIKPRERKNKEGKIVHSSINDIEAIKRIIQKHYNEENAYNIQSAYLYSYSILFKCSIDYLFETTEIRSSDLSVADICKKTGLSENTVVRLCEDYQINNEEDSFSRAGWWSNLLSSDAYYSFPTAWGGYAQRIVQLYDIKKKADSIEKATDEVELDSIMRTFQEMKSDTLRRLCREKEDSTFGAYHKMLSGVENYLNQTADEWAKKQHPEYSDLYYRSEINKLELLESLEKIHDL